MHISHENRPNICQGVFLMAPLIEHPADVGPAPHVYNTAAHDGAVIDEWESDCNAPKTDGAVARLMRSMSQLLMHRRSHAQTVP